MTAPNFDQVASLVNELRSFAPGLTTRAMRRAADMLRRAADMLTELIDENLRLRKSAWTQSAERCEALTLSAKVIQAEIGMSVAGCDYARKHEHALSVIGKMLEEVK